MSPGPGIVVLVLGLLGMVLSAHFKGLRYFDRPSLARTAWFDPALDLVKWLLLLAGLALLARASLAFLFVAAGALAALGGYRRFIRSARFQQRLLARDCAALRRDRPGLSDEEMLFEIAFRRHPRWGPELIEQMVRDYPTVESFARIMVKMERGFRGFSGKRARPD
ncbi:MAG: hypothetical protein AUI47_12690 [Acidobacteria bacterium 13_1_40CM_2_68_5]|nr:MAG: hypothetical protein AUI47_12690 [Acidobacteria bacterium 13_1_40CM_2_68_5]